MGKLKETLVYPDLEDYVSSPEELEILERIQEEARKTAPPPGVRPKILPPLRLKQKAKSRGNGGEK